MKKTFKIFFTFLICLSFFSLLPKNILALNVSVNIPEKYASIAPGEKFYFEVSIKYPENPRRKDLRMIYEIRQGDEVVAQAKLLKAIETQSSFMDSLNIPEDAKGKLSTIDVKVQDYESLNEEASNSFFIKGGGLGKTEMYFIATIATIILVGVAVIIVVLRRPKQI